jgi:hypothetical protein
VIIRQWSATGRQWPDRDLDQKKLQIDLVKSMESAGCGLRSGAGLAKILATKNLLAKYPVQRT